MGYELRTPESETQWRDYHDIRRKVLWEARGRFGEYDSTHPDESRPGNFPKLLILDGVAIGVIRVDLQGSTAWFRRVAITAARQRSGSGKILFKLAEEFARELGATRIESSVDPGATLFYQRCEFCFCRDQPKTEMYKVL